MPNPGVQSQFIAKSGGNQFSGEGYLDWYNNSLQGSNLPDNYITPVAQGGLGIREGSNEIDKYYDTAINTGGPIKQDKLWWFGTYRTQKNAVAQPAFAFDKTFDTKLWNAVGKLTYQANQNNKIIGYYQWGQKSQPNRLLGCTGCALHLHGPGTDQPAGLGQLGLQGRMEQHGQRQGLPGGPLRRLRLLLPAARPTAPTTSCSATPAPLTVLALGTPLAARPRPQAVQPGQHLLPRHGHAWAPTPSRPASKCCARRGWEGYEQRWGGNVEHLYANGVSSSVSFGFPSATGRSRQPERARRPDVDCRR